MELSAESVLALAPDAASAKAANGLLKPGGWPLLGANAAAVWGECQGSGSKPYQTQVDLSGPTFKCSCPSRKFPCKHGLALLLLKAKDASLFKTDTPPLWVSEWLGARTERVQKKEDKQREQAAKPVDPQAVIKGQQQRWSRIDAGVTELRQWLLDQVARGLGSLGNDSRAAWETMAARLVDAKAPGLGQRLGSLADDLMNGSDWPEKVLRQLGLLQLACDAVARRESLSDTALADLRILLGWPLDKEDVLAESPGVQDTWQVMGMVQEERENNLQERRVWLQGQTTGRRALLLDHVFGGKGFEQGWFCGSSVKATLAFYPSAGPLRALVAGSAEAPATTTSAVQPAASPSPEQEWRAVAERVAGNPWVALHPLYCQQATPCQNDNGFGLHWAGRHLPLAVSESQGSALMALSGGQPVSVMGEWNGDVLRPLSVQGDDGVWNWSAQ